MIYLPFVSGGLCLKINNFTVETFFPINLIISLAGTHFIPELAIRAKNAPLILITFWVCFKNWRNLRFMKIEYYDMEMTLGVTGILFVSASFLFSKKFHAN